VSSSEFPPKSRPGRRRRADDEKPDTGWLANHPASRVDSKIESRRPEGRSPSGLDTRPSSKRVAPPPTVLHGDAPNERVLVSIVTPSQDALAYTHAFVAAYCQRRFRVSVADALILAAHELLENAITYGSVASHVLFEIVEKQGSAAVRVTNQTTPGRIDMLRAHIEKMAVKSEVLMVEEMKRTMGTRLGRPMLGLARVVQEAGLGLELYVTRGRVTVVARAAT